MAELKIYTNSEGDCVVAYDPSDALLVNAEFQGYQDPGLYQSDYGEMPSDWDQMEDGPLTIAVEDEGDVTQHTTKWIIDNGRGYLCGPNL